MHLLHKYTKSLSARKIYCESGGLNKKRAAPIIRVALIVSDLLSMRLLADSCDTRELLALESLEHSATTGRYIAYLVSVTHLSNGCN